MSRLAGLVCCCISVVCLLFDTAWRCTLLGAVHCSVLHIALGCTLLSTAHCSRLHIALSCTLLGAAHCSWLHTALGYTLLSAALLLTTHCSQLHIAFGSTMPHNTTKRNITKRIYTHYAILVSVCVLGCGHGCVHCTRRLYSRHPFL